MITGTFQPDNPPKKWKEFYGDFVMEPDGTIFPLPWIFAGCSQMEAFLCASYDGEPVMQSSSPIGSAPRSWISSPIPMRLLATARLIRRKNGAIVSRGRLEKLMTARGRYYTHHRNDRYVEHDKAHRYNHGYAESPATLLKAYEAGLERTRQRLAEQREELKRLARARHNR
jgi:hypothetical protein